MLGLRGALSQRLSLLRPPAGGHRHRGGSAPHGHRAAVPAGGGARVKLKLPRPPSPGEVFDKVRESEAWRSIFRPGSVFRKGYKDTQRDRALAAMNNVLYHLHPVKLKRHGLKLTYTFCLGGLSFFLFILLTVTGIYLMFFYRPAAELAAGQAYQDIETIRNSVVFGDMVRNIHRWGAHLMVITVFLHMGRVFYTGAYKPPREFNWVVGVILLLVTLLLAFSGYLLPWDQLSFWPCTSGGSGRTAASRGPCRWLSSRRTSTRRRSTGSSTSSSSRA